MATTITDAEMLRIAHALHSFFGAGITLKLGRVADDLIRTGDLAKADLWMGIVEEIQRLETKARGQSLH